MKIKRILSLLVVLCLAFGNITFASDYATRGEVAGFLLQAADFYNPDVVKEDIIKGYEDGLLHEERNVTRAEALVMLKRAFGSLPEPKGHNKRVALIADDFKDIPSWAEEELQEIFNSGIVAGTASNTFSPHSYVTMEQMQLFVKRVYSLYGENPCDDFYATANKKILENMKISQGEYMNGTLSMMQSESALQVYNIIKKAVEGNNKKGTPEQKIADMYKCFVDTGTINKTSVKPIENYIKDIDSVKNIGELSLVQEKLSKDLLVNPFIEFNLTADMENSEKYMLCFSSFSPFMHKEFYFEEEEKSQKAYINYLKTLLVVAGESAVDAEEKALEYFEFEKHLANDMLSSEELYDVEKINNVYKFNKLESLFPDFDLKTALENMYLKKSDRVIVADTGLLEGFSAMYNQANIEVLKTAAKISLLDMWGTELDMRVDDAVTELEKTLFGMEGSYTRSQKAEIMLKNVMPDYLGKIYIEEYFDEKSKQDVLNMALDIKEMFKERIKKLDWMSVQTKEKAIKKLDSMHIMIGYPDRFDSFIDEIDIVPPEKGGTLFTNMLKIATETVKNRGMLQFMQRDRTAWPIETYTVNAGYDLTTNSIVFPAAILQYPLYDKKATYEENLGGIGYIIAHEMSHAFDNNGALFDENGNICNWWLSEDFEKFEKLCDDVVEFYNGYEPIAGVATNGTLTLSENVADLGAAACITELLGKRNRPDYKKLYCAMANNFATTYTREYARYALRNDPHADNKARINCVLVHLDEFYEAFDIKQGDGMFVEPENRIVIW